MWLYWISVSVVAQRNDLLEELIQRSGQFFVKFNFQLFAVAAVKLF